MGLKIWKWPLEMTDVQTLHLPREAKLLTIQEQHGCPCLWALCDDEAPKEARHIAIYGTGNPLPAEPGEHVATFQLFNGRAVFHAFEAKPSVIEGGTA